jgi:hypothetical protein
MVPVDWLMLRGGETGHRALGQMTLTDPAEGRAWAVWVLDHEPAA